MKKGKKKAPVKGGVGILGAANRRNSRLDAIMGRTKRGRTRKPKGK